MRYIPSISCNNCLLYCTSGELLIRHSLEHAFEVLGVQLDVMTSDAAFLKANGDRYDIIIVDPWYVSASSSVASCPVIV